MTQDQMDRIVEAGEAFVQALNDAGADLEVTVSKKDRTPRRDQVGCVIISPLVYGIELRSTTVTRIE